jgi:hypothetical protein
LLGGFATAGVAVLGGCEEGARETGGGAVGTADDSEETAGDASSVACEFVSQVEIDGLIAAGEATPEQMTAPYQSCEDLVERFRNYRSVANVYIVNAYGAAFVPGSKVVATKAGLLQVRAFEYDENEFYGEGTHRFLLSDAQEDGLPSSNAVLCFTGEDVVLSPRLRDFRAGERKTYRDGVEGVRRELFAVERGEVIVEEIGRGRLDTPLEIGGSNFFMYVIGKTPIPDLSNSPDQWIGRTDWDSILRN